MDSILFWLVFSPYYLGWIKCNLFHKQIGFSRFILHPDFQYPVTQLVWYFRLAANLKIKQKPLSG